MKKLVTQKYYCCKKYINLLNNVQHFNFTFIFLSNHRSDSPSFLFSLKKKTLPHALKAIFLFHFYFYFRFSLLTTHFRITIDDDFLHHHKESNQLLLHKVTKKQQEKFFPSLKNNHLFAWTLSNCNNFDGILRERTIFYIFFWRHVNWKKYSFHATFSLLLFFPTPLYRHTHTLPQFILAILSITHTHTNHNLVNKIIKYVCSKIA